MEHMTVAEAERNFSELVDRVVTQGITVELERHNQVIARISPAGRWVPVSELNRILAGLPSLGEEAESFGVDLDRIRCELPKEIDPWD